MEGKFEIGEYIVLEDGDQRIKVDRDIFQSIIKKLLDLGAAKYVRDEELSCDSGSEAGGSGH